MSTAYVPVPAGWYTDPDGVGFRYWDGASWTAHRSTPTPAAETWPPVPTPRRRRTSRRGLIACVVAVVAIGALVGVTVAMAAGVNEDRLRAAGRASATASGSPSTTAVPVQAVVDLALSGSTMIEVPAGWRFDYTAADGTTYASLWLQPDRSFAGSVPARYANRLQEVTVASTWTSDASPDLEDVVVVTGQVAK